MRTIGRFWMLALVLALPTGAQMSSQPTTVANTSQDEVLWAEICALAQQPAGEGDYATQLGALADRRRDAVERARRYLASYPGGARCEDVLAIELTALFELGVLDGAAFAELQERVAFLREHPPCTHGESEIAYWGMICHQLRRTGGTKSPAQNMVGGYDAEALAEFRKFVGQYPQSRYVPRLAENLFAAAERAGDVDEQRRLVAVLKEAFAEHPVTQRLAGRLRQRDAVGEPFTLPCAGVGDATINTADFGGRVVLVVLWSAADERSRKVVEAVRDLAAERDDVVPIGVNVDPTEARMRRACQELRIDWPQCHDGLGWAGGVVRDWGIDAAPAVLVVNRGGKLAGVGDAESWRGLVEQTLRN